MKVCPQCKTKKKTSSFYSNKSNSNGLSAYCNSCERTYHRKYYRKDKVISATREKKKFDAFYCTVNGRATHLLNNAHKRAKQLGIKCNLTQGWIMKRLEKGVCEVTGLPLIVKINGGKGHRNNSFAPSLDRIKRKGGYTTTNVRLVCWIYNRARGAFPDADLIKMSKALVRKV